MSNKLPEVAVNINGDLGVKDWRREPTIGMTQRFTMDEKREVARRANAYPKLVEALREAESALSYYAKHARGALNDRPAGVGAKAARLLRELGEEA